MPRETTVTSSSMWHKHRNNGGYESSCSWFLVCGHLSQQGDKLCFIKSWRSQDRRKREEFGKYYITAQTMRQLFAPCRASDSSIDDSFWPISGFAVFSLYPFTISSTHLEFPMMWHQKKDQVSGPTHNSSKQVESSPTVQWKWDIR